MTTPVSEHYGATLRFTVPGAAVGKGRARSAVLMGKDKRPVMKGGRAIIQHYTPENTRSFESLVKDLAAQAMGPSPIIRRPIELEVTLWIPIPSGWPAWKREAAIRQEIAPTSKPDTSNVLKSIEDAMIGVVFVDDAQVFSTQLLKLYITDDCPARTDVVVRENYRCSNNITKKDQLWLLR